MRKQNSQYTVHSWIKWVLLGLILIVISCLTYLFFLYSDIQDNRTLKYQDSKDAVIEKTSVSQIENITEYNGKNQFHVIFGSTNEGANKIVFVPLNENSGKLTTFNQAEIISQQEIKNSWAKQCEDCELIDITPAIENSEPLWEVTYIDDSNRYIFDYLSMFDGTRVQQYRLKSIFN
ncbi:DUF5590 domain-containing protein [Virgibacillus sp. DJP39]|uniref:cell wall elongation regulator TseB-like domain-containing protein n=1 Tax=Virgibacillus sp. DJP39 TaxID=3409790 RepID=UPI003BB4E911